MTAHSGEKPNKGIIYGKALSDKGNIQRHMRTHSGENLIIAPTMIKFCPIKIILTFILICGRSLANAPSIIKYYQDKVLFI